ncbi:transporter substrate-binding domain-containing diguanylate cyclase [Zongyangia hominis]|uniref:Diguanylate cyclase n=1 Tax=Zongyangia hominis TaxID=2763677 RepID=A0A926ECH3_9FIRM|nr:diguanylate cyclase [Zongyangia hominis]MBC8569232.1 diguanylate cyclase [Zongyangia hominis]
MSRRTPIFSTTLYEKYFVPEYNEILLSDAESAYVGEGRTLRVGVVTNRPPYQFMDKKGFAGISVDFLQYIAENTGLQFELVPVTGTQQQEQLIESGALDMMAGITYDYQLAQTLGVAMTRPYLSTQYVLILNDAVNEQEMSGRRLAVVKNLGVQPGDAENLVYFDTIDECIRAVNRGEADATYVDASTAQYYINHPEYNQLKVISQIHDQWQLCFGVAKSQTRHLLSILNKAIASVPADQMQAFVYDNTMYQQQITLWSFIQSHPAEVVAVVLAFLLCIVALLLIWMRQRVKANRKMALDLKKHLQIYSLVNDYFIEYDFQADTLMVTSPATDQEDSVKIHTYSCGDAGEDIVGGGILDYIRAHDQGVVEMEQRWLDGQNHWLRLAVKTVHDDEGNPAYTIGKVTMIDEEKREQELLIEQAQQDGLTGVLNARAVRLQVEQNLAELSGQESGALLLIDIDNFKSINDTFGHMRGDEILKKVAGLLARSFRSNDVVGRPGGDEFIVYMRNVRDLRDLQDKCGDLCGKVRKIKIASGRYATISLGAALACSGSDYVEVYERADKALYQAKEKGRDRYEIALPESVSEAAGPKEDAGGRGLES